MKSHINLNKEEQALADVIWERTFPKGTDVSTKYQDAIVQMLRVFTTEEQREKIFRDNPGWCELWEKSDGGMISLSTKRRIPLLYLDMVADRLIQGVKGRSA